MASILASCELRYWPLALAAAGSVFGPMRRHDDVITRTPCSSASSPRYAPHGQTAMITSTGQVSGLMPSSP